MAFSPLSRTSTMPPLHPTHAHHSHRSSISNKIVKRKCLVMNSIVGKSWSGSHHRIQHPPCCRWLRLSVGSPSKRSVNAPSRFLEPLRHQNAASDLPSLSYEDRRQENAWKKCYAHLTPQWPPMHSETSLSMHNTSLIFDGSMRSSSFCHLQRPLFLYLLPRRRRHWFPARPL